MRYRCCSPLLAHSLYRLQSFIKRSRKKAFGVDGLPWQRGQPERSDCLQLDFLAQRLKRFQPLSELLCMHA